MQVSCGVKKLSGQFLQLEKEGLKPIVSITRVKCAEVKEKPIMKIFGAVARRRPDSHMPPDL
jgi:hypothetical protein